VTSHPKPVAARSSDPRPPTSDSRPTLARFLLHRAVREWLQYPAKELSVNIRVALVALGLAASSVFGASVNESEAPAAVEEVTQIPSTAPPTSRSIATLPTVAPPRETKIPSETTPPRAGFAVVSVPSGDPDQRLTPLPTVTPSREPKPPKCDPAYPEARTCIPPGPPFDQGCAITAERLFPVLPPDPQALDHDFDGIGCEPIVG